jgi:O-antigen/teichoic acid export membrane protein
MVPVFVGLGWLAHPFIAFVYGAQWLGVATPLSILCIGGIFVCIGHPSGAVMAAHNRLGREMVVQVINAGVVALGCVIGIRWGLDGVAWAMLIALAYGTMHLGWLARQCLSASLWDLLRALFPGLLLNGMLLCVLFILDVWGFDNVRGDSPLVYLVSMSAIGAASYVAAFLYLPIPALASESTRWKKLLRLM